MENGPNMDRATFVAGCFWDVEVEFRRIEGVAATAVGYMGGTVPEPTYEQICSGTTGHSEVVQFIFDPSVITYDRLLDIFWSIHDPTRVNHQGEWVGYRSAIFYHSKEQKAMAEVSRDRLAASGKCGGRKIVTQIIPASEFWRADECHQQFYKKSGLGYCAIPKYWE